MQLESSPRCAVLGRMIVWFFFAKQYMSGFEKIKKKDYS
jgi:hypothetical protein